MKIVTVLGARPQFIKAAALSRVLRTATGLEEVLVHTGQHYDENMSAIFFQELSIPEPRYHLGVGSGAHGAETGRMLERIEQVLHGERPDLVLVYGDTNSTLAGALAASKMHIPIAHVEAGLRSFNRTMPEEINRVLTDHLSRWLFAPTDAAVANLRREGIDAKRTFLVGDVMYDAALFFSTEKTEALLERFGVRSKEYILATIHRAENTDEAARLKSILAGLCEAARQIPVLMPLHPRTRAVLRREQLAEAEAGSLRLIDPVGYVDMVGLERHARLIVTDSGGVQKEAFFHRVPCVTLRNETEWVELIEMGWNELVPPTDAAAVRDGVLRGLVESRRRAPATDLYGGGRAAGRIVELLRQAA